MALYNIPLVYIVHNELPTIDERYAALIICESTAQRSQSCCWGAAKEWGMDHSIEIARGKSAPHRKHEMFNHPRL